MAVMRKCEFVDYIFVSLFIVLNLIAVQPRAATVLNVDFNDMLIQSEFVFEGKVIGSETVRGENINQTRTVYEFQILDVIKGEYPEQTIKLSFAGGTVDGTTLAVGGLHYPQSGETGVYFVETLSKNLVHPFFGWSQGHFLVTDEDTISTRNNIPVVDVVETKSSEFNSQLTDGDGVARGVILQTSQQPQEAMSSDAFKRKLRNLLNR